MTPTPDFMTHLSLYRPWIQSMARRLAKGNRDLVDDLEQAGLITLWKMSTTSRTSIIKSPTQYIRGSITLAMLTFLRGERRARDIASRSRTPVRRGQSHSRS